MNKYTKITAAILILIIFTLSIFIFFDNRSNIYIHSSSPAVSFAYPREWGAPRVVDQMGTNGGKFQVDFQNYRFSISNGFYFSDVEGHRPTIKELLRSYENDKNNRNEVKSYEIQSIKVAGYPAVKVTVDNLNNTQYIDVYIYKETQNTNDYLIVSADRDFVDDELFSKVLSSMKLESIKSSSTAT